MNKYLGKATAEFKWARRVAWLTGILILAGWVSLIRFGLPEDFWLVVIMTAGILLYAVLALLIIQRYPRHTVGWLFLLTGLIGSLMVFNGLALFAWGTQWNSALALGIITWFDLQLQAPWSMIPISLVLLFFPDGHLPSPRWKAVLILVLIAIFYIQATQAFSPWVGELRGPFDADNPLEIPGSELIFDGLISTFFEVLTILAILGCLFAVIIRFVRSKGVERMQVKWLVYSAAVIISLIIIQLLLGVPESHPEIMWYFTIISPALLALAIGLAILRFRLFDIDVIIRRTLQYTLLTGLLVLVYFGSVVLLQGLVENLTGEQSPIVIVISTLAIAALFNPLRSRVQDFIDRRFYRSKYNSDKALANFASAARDEVEMDKLTAALLGVMEETLQPKTAVLWLKKIERNTSGER
jgi:hypothetical protein